MFHLGVLWRLNEAAMLPTLARVSSVSGGSITGSTNLSGVVPFMLLLFAVW
jgi:hypothetical protein